MMTVAVMKTKAELALAEQFQSAKAALPGGPGVAHARQEAMAAFAELGLPHRRIEAWKYTDLRTVLKDPVPPAVGDATKLTVGDLIVALGPYMELEAPRIVFVNGHYRRALSNLTGAEAVHVAPLSENFDAVPPEPTGAVIALNTAFVTDGAVVNIPPGYKLEKPLLIVSLSAGKEPRFATLRHTIHAGAGAQATIVELFVPLPGSSLDQQTNALTRVIAGDRAHVTHIKAASDGGRATHLSNWLVGLGTGTHYRGFHMTSGLALARSDIAVKFAGEGAKLDMSGVFLGRGNDHIDTTLVVDHAVPHCESRELFAGVLDDRARGIFQGKIIVRPDAQKTDGKMMARAMMLSPGVEFDSKPELEIYADDVVCGHGSTVAEIDEDLMFYCQARGIPADEARAMLVESFIGEAIERVDHEALRVVLTKTAIGWLNARTT